jgi:DNA topoisomerase I
VRLFNPKEKRMRRKVAPCARGKARASATSARISAKAIHPAASPEIKEATRVAGLRYSFDASPCISRIGSSRFTYRWPDGKRVTERAVLDRIKSLVIPPAWAKVWISIHENGHIQAVGRDARGRKQYRYHERWREVRDENKFERMLGFARVLPRIRRRVARDLKRRDMPREKVLATIVRLLEVSLIRVGNEEYVSQNGSYGLTTMRNRHAHVSGGTIQFSFRGKSGKRHEISVHDPRLARIVRLCQDLPGQELFEYKDEAGKIRDLASDDINTYLREIGGEEYTAKDFRTWAGTVLAAIALREFEAVKGKTEAIKNIRTAIAAVAQVLGNTPAVCRKCYIHPEVLSSYLDGRTISTVEQRIAKQINRSFSKLKTDEVAVIALLRRTRVSAASTPDAKS